MSQQITLEEVKEWLSHLVDEANSNREPLRSCVESAEWREALTFAERERESIVSAMTIPKELLIKTARHRCSDWVMTASQEIRCSVISVTTETTEKTGNAECQ